MADKRSKRKRNIKEDPIDMSKIKKAKEYLENLKDELDGLRETHDDMDSIMTYIQSLETILQDVQKPVCGSVTTSVLLIQYFRG
jgi:hypothetical protein